MIRDGFRGVAELAAAVSSVIVPPHAILLHEIIYCALYMITGTKL